MTEILKVEHLKAGYGNRVILKDVSFGVNAGEIRVILGGSGCGKSTLLNNILQLEKPLGGSISFFGQEYPATVPIPDEVRKRTGVLFQGGALLTSLTVAENVALPLQRHKPGMPKKMMDEIIADRLEKVHMMHAFNKYPSELSGGMKKRAALARALALEPELLFCDEPSAGLDPITARSLDELLLTLRDDLKISVVIVTHELESIKTICDKFVFLKEGEVLLDGTLKQGLESDIPEIRTFFDRKCPDEAAGARYYDFDFVD
ncbi:ABC transporter ATP-binding protein [Fibrobacter sp. UWEL]|uniref:ABC transporter ATP-binding protein n=1 Tax=Fibrobacter sp. UWEL TaxID=1896209 RepID=UPI0009243A4A|nr:ATP-binding cassette domain-containing protein [Fibrobacter sp. UWEL]SHL01295.1 phospholipid/cholesterol/gamma-HCH transport system ATP-binding protein [Fibrobacter sp. UWEL]